MKPEILETIITIALSVGACVLLFFIAKALFFFIVENWVWIFLVLMAVIFGVGFVLLSKNDGESIWRFLQRRFWG